MTRDRPQRTVQQIRADCYRHGRTCKTMAWICGVQSALGALAILFTDGGWGWAWFIVGFILLFVYVGLIVMNNATLKILEGLDDDD